MKITKSLIRCLKTLFYVFNVLFLVIGVALLSLGVWTKIALLSYLKLSSSADISVTPYIFIGMGGFIILFGLMGCWAAVKEHRCVLRFYMFFLLLILVCELIAAITGYVMRNKLRSNFRDGINKAMHEYRNDSVGATKQALDDVQHKLLHCCGLNSYKDWFTLWNTTSVPKSCCKDDKQCNYNHVTDANKNEIYQDGCFGAMEKFADKHLEIIAGTAVGVAVFQIVGIIIVHCLAKGLREVSTYETM